MDIQKLNSIYMKNKTFIPNRDRPGSAVICLHFTVLQVDIYIFPKPEVCEPAFLGVCPRMVSAQTSARAESNLETISSSLFRLIKF